MEGTFNDSQVQQAQQAQENLIQVILANASSAAKISNILCDHSDDKILKADEIICGLIYRLMTPMTEQEITDSMTEAKELMYEESSDEEEDDDDMVGGSNIVDDIDDLNIKRKVKVNHCNCEICSQVRVCLLNFNEYLPKDELGDKFKASIIETCETHNRII
tara:strand:+ start:29 stop:514 length:486 start_codon:yes stop_codon:yes gene_type:complete